MTAPTRPQTEPSPPSQQFDRSNDPKERAAMDADAASEAMRSRHQAFTGSAAGIGSVGFDERGAFDVGVKPAPGVGEPNDDNT